MVASQADQDILERVDIAVYSRNGQLQLVVEVKARTDATSDWAVQMRRNLAAQLALPDSPYFLLALPDHFYLWRNAFSATTVAPDYDLNPEPLLAPYIPSNRRPFSPLSAYGLLLAVSSWLATLVNSELDEGTVDQHLAWVLESGLYAAIKGGTVKV